MRDFCLYQSRTKENLLSLYSQDEPLNVASVEPVQQFGAPPSPYDFR